MKPEVRASRDAIGWEARAQFRGEPLDGPLTLKLAFHWPDKRKHDIDNGLKVLLDALTDILWWDDDQIVDLRITKAHDKENPRVELELIPAVLH